MAGCWARRRTADTTALAGWLEGKLAGLLADGLAGGHALSCPRPPFWQRTRETEGADCTALVVLVSCESLDAAPGARRARRGGRNITVLSPVWPLCGRIVTTGRMMISLRKLTRCMPWSKTVAVVAGGQRPSRSGPLYLRYAGAPQANRPHASRSVAGQSLISLWQVAGQSLVNHQSMVRSRGAVPASRCMSHYMSQYLSPSACSSACSTPGPVAKSSLQCPAAAPGPPLLHLLPPVQGRC